MSEKAKEAYDLVNFIEAEKRAVSQQVAAQFAERIKALELEIEKLKNGHSGEHRGDQGLDNASKSPQA